jgi:hypothetical protein
VGQKAAQNCAAWPRPESAATQPAPARCLRATLDAHLLHAFVAGIRREVSVAELCTEFKCNGIKTSIRQTLEAFKRQFWASLPESRREDADFSRLPSLHV